MLNHSLLKFDANGRIRYTAGTPAHFSGGVPFNATGLPCMSFFGSIDHQHNGQSYNSEGLLLAVSNVSVESFAQGGLAMNAGRIVVATAAPIDHYNSGLPCSDTGALCVGAQE